jgi:hypothetical protein
MQHDTFIPTLLGNDLKNLWQAIHQQPTDALCAQLRAGDLPEAGSPLRDILLELLENGDSDTLDAQVFCIDHADSDLLFKNLIRLLFALALHGGMPRAEQLLAGRLLAESKGISQEVQDRSGGYPQGSINSAVWVTGASMRDALGWLGHYFMTKKMVKEQFVVQNRRTLMTLAIMSHYPYLVFPDMVRMAALEEQLGQTEDAITHYEAVTLDAQASIDWYREHPDAAPDDQDRIALRFVALAWDALDQLRGSSEGQAQIALIEQIMARKTVASPKSD